MAITAAGVASTLSRASGWHWRQRHTSQKLASGAKTACRRISSGIAALTRAMRRSCADSCLKAASGSVVDPSGDAATDENPLVQQAKARAAEIIKTQGNKPRGPNLTLLRDPLTNQVFESQNLTKFNPADLDPIVKANYDKLMADVAAGKIAPYAKWTEAGIHGELMVASDALKARRAAGLPVSEALLTEFELVNINLRGATKGLVRPSCRYCEIIVPAQQVGMASKSASAATGVEAATAAAELGSSIPATAATSASSGTLASSVAKISEVEGFLAKTGRFVGRVGRILGRVAVVATPPLVALELNNAIKDSSDITNVNEINLAMKLHLSDLTGMLMKNGVLVNADGAIKRPANITEVLNNMTDASLKNVIEICDFVKQETISMCDVASAVSSRLKNMSLPAAWGRRMVNNAKESADSNFEENFQLATNAALIKAAAKEVRQARREALASENKLFAWKFTTEIGRTYLNAGRQYHGFVSDLENDIRARKTDLRDFGVTEPENDPIVMQLESTRTAVEAIANGLTQTSQSWFLENRVPADSEVIVLLSRAALEFSKVSASSAAK